MKRLEEEPIKRGRYVKRMQDQLPVDAGRYVGKRGGIREPFAIEWRTNGTSIFMLCDRETGHPALFPHVKYRNGAGTVRSARADEWHEWTAKARLEEAP